ncbi:SusC/RagA family TonB-linked outer membrane protein [Alistipes sp. ZOR0009]|jgi:iron complex outermembrane receptor protein|uniref:SusC/RagA family TonB-linked outer membrane protein n=1 Tax=Alistipes sp. ZOR0009 TaxID=1339253 RepID=UPI000646DE84|nr:SusC/RagA family TonB-linked outer membrane protein [Alistipes sp. ZOR0009]
MGKLLKQAVGLTVLFILLGFSNGIYAQKAITGVVKDAANGGTLPGVNVTVKEKAGVGTVTDIDGKFSLKLPEGAKTLVFSFIGYTSQDVAIAGKTSIEVQLQADARKLDEVVVTALGIKRQTKALGYAVTELKGDDLKTNNINPVSSLQGKVAGVDIASSDGGMFGSTKIQIRGASTLKGNNQPIYVVDGIILDNGVSKSGDADWDSDSKDFGNELKNLNPDDFESVSVLKGAAATALYGSRGLFGAVVITTKSGKARKGLGISLTQTFGIDHVFAAPDMQNEYGSGNYFGNVGYGLPNPAGGYFKYDNANQFYLNAKGDASLRAVTTNRHFGPSYDIYSNKLVEDYDGVMRRYAAVKDNYTDAYQLGYNSNTNLAITGGNDRTTFYSSLSYKKATGTLPRNSFERFAFLTKASQKISDKVRLDASLSFANSLPKNPQPNLGDYFSQGVLGRSYDTKRYMNNYKGVHGGVANSDYGDANGYNPGADLWFSIYENSAQQKETNVRPTLSLDVDLLSWVKFKTEGSFNYYYVRGESKILGQGYANEGGSYSLSESTKEQTNLNASFIFNKTLGDWTFGGFLRGEYFNTFTQSMDASTNGGLIVPGQYFLKNSKNAISSTGKIEGTKRMMSVAFQASASWKNQIFMDVTGRNDWSSALVYANGSGNYSYFYPSVNGSWLVSETFKLPDWISFGKFRASWAQVGNDTDPYVINSGYEMNKWSIGDGFVYGLKLPNMAYDPSIKPERKNAWEVGADWRFLGSRINLDATYYKENTKNQIMQVDVPSVSGVDKMFINAGNIQNSGVEIALNTIPFKSKDWEWSLDFTYTRNESKIISLHESVADFITLDGSTNYGNYRVGSVAKVGGSYGVLMSDILPKKDAQGRNVFVWRDDFRVAYPARSGKVEEVGKITPDFLGSMSTGLRWKDLSVRVSLDARFGGYIASFGSRYATAYGISESSLKWRDPSHGGITFKSIWDGKTYSDGMIPDGVFDAGQVIKMPDGTSKNIGGMTYKEAYEKGFVDPVHASAYHYWTNAWSSGTINDNWFKKLSYIALRDITLNYNMPASIFSKIGAKNLSLAFSARNLGYLYNTMPNNENPESVRGTRSSQFRVRSFSPYTANYMFTINVGF